jgi:hypothetical protein
MQAPEGVALPGSGLALVTGLIALVISAAAFHRQSTWSRSVVVSFHVLSTIVHEMGHAVVTVATGGAVRAVVIDSPRTGSTQSSGISWLTSIIVAAAGYAAPPLAGLGVAALIDRGQPRAALALTVVVMGLVLLVGQGLRTRASVVVVGFVVFAAMRWGSAGLQLWVVYTEAWLLLLCEIPAVWILLTARLRGADSSGDDAAQLFRRTLIPGPIWIAGWLVLNGWALWTAVPLLWP